MRALVIAPHPDDEVLGVGGTIARLTSSHNDVVVGIVTKGDASMFGADLVEQGRREAREAHRLLGVRETIFLEGLPAAMLDIVPQHKLNAALSRLVRDVQPNLVFVPFSGDVHRDHQLVFDSMMVAIRPNGDTASRVESVYAYETLSETNWNAPLLTPGFSPNVFVDVSQCLQQKIASMKAYASQLREAPHERSLRAIEALATLRGSTIGVLAAEAFVLIRAVYRESIEIGTL